MRSWGPIILPADPTEDLEAVTKQYVDANAGGGGGSTHWEPVVFDGELVFFDGDIVMHEVPN